jgi:RNA recognition motif-containing protein
LSQDPTKEEKTDEKVPVVISGNKVSKQDMKVREIWLGNLPKTITSQILYSHFFICGEIEEIEIFKQNKTLPYYAFIRFKLTNCTKRAYDLATGLEIAGSKIKVQFSDPNKRGQTIIGDVPGYDLTSSNCTTLFVAFQVSSQLPDQSLVEQIFS